VQKIVAGGDAGGSDVTGGELTEQLVNSIAQRQDFTPLDRGKYGG